jgi:hypothetical protein
MTRREMFAMFLENGGTCHLSSNDQMIAAAYASGRSYNEIANEWGCRHTWAKDQVSRIKHLIDRVNNKQAQKDERESLIGYLKASGKPLSEIPIDELFPFRLENALHSAGIYSLGDIVSKGYVPIYRTRHIGEVGLMNIKVILGHFGAELPGWKEHRG